MVFLCVYYCTCFEELDLLSIRFEDPSDIRYNFADIDIFFFCLSVNNLNIAIVCFTNAINIMYSLFLERGIFNPSNLRISEYK